MLVGFLNRAKDATVIYLSSDFTSTECHSQSLAAD
jgi:hypothetical protein